MNYGETLSPFYQSTTKLLKGIKWDFECIIRSDLYLHADLALLSLQNTSMVANGTVVGGFGKKFVLVLV